MKKVKKKEPVQVWRCPHCWHTYQTKEECERCMDRHFSLKDMATDVRLHMRHMRMEENGPMGQGFAVIRHTHSGDYVVKGICLGMQVIRRHVGRGDETFDIYCDLYAKDYDNVGQHEERNRKDWWSWRDQRGFLGSYRLQELYPTRRLAWQALRGAKENG